MRKNSRNRQDITLRRFPIILTGLMMLAWLLGAPMPAQASITTTAGSALAKSGPASLIAGNRTLTVKIPYTGDTDTDNTALIEWDEDGGDWASLIGSQALPHSASPYSYDITGLDNSLSYQVRVTIIDADGGSNLVQTLTGLKTFNPLVHNSVSTGSNKHSGNWGLADGGSQYGEFTCFTCHARNTNNIKRVKGTITAPTGSFPGNTVSFQNAADTTSDFGDDTRVTPTASTNVCEVCHSATDYHRYNATTNPGGTGHFNKKDCTSCHKHSDAFKASCSGCHGNSATGAMWPDDSTPHAANDDPNGRHAKHIEVLADRAFGQTLPQLLADTATETKQKALCEYCHAANTNDTDHASATAADVFVASGGGRHAKTTWNTADGDAAYNSGNDSCSNIDCHNSKPTAIGTYGWYNAGTATCDLCHSADPATGAHTAHISANYGPVLGSKCGTCHEANDYSTNMTGISSHMNGSVDFTGGVLLAAATDCNSCHGGATPAATAKTNWATAAKVSCESCHGGGDSVAIIGGVSAPNRTLNYSSAGHGRTSGANPNKACSACHAELSDHISAASGDANRLDASPNNGYVYTADTTAGNDFCNDCHLAAMPVHYGNARTPSGNSSDGLYCNTCHDPHGNDGYDAMVKATIQSRAVASFTDRSQRAQYFNDNGASDNSGVCQACHELENASQVKYFNRTDTPPAHYAGNCISCHQHDAAEAFKPSGCNGCHGDATAGNYWPDTASEAIGSYPDRTGLHAVHVDPIGQKLAGVNDATWAAMNATDKLNHKNNSCDYCHPDPGGSNVNGGSHDANTAGSVATIADLHKDGYNPGTSYKTMLGAVDSDGLYNPTIKRCSTVDCHSNGEFTWTWHTDALAPGTVSNLAAATGSEPKTIDLTWTTPYNDGAAGPNAYHYRVKRSSSPITTGALYNSATDAGGPPTVTRRGNQETMTVYGLTPGQTYHFALKTADEAYNWSGVSNSVSATPKTDTLAPIFWGIGAAEPDDEVGTIALSWDEGKDHTLPITYRVFYSVGSINYNSVQATTKNTNYRVSGLPTGVLYNFAVRAADGVTPTANVDINDVVIQQMAKTPAKIDYSYPIYYTSGTTALQTGTYGTASSSALSAARTFQGPVYAVDTNVFGYGFSCRFRNSNENVPATIKVELGYTTGGTWNNFSPAISMNRSIEPISNRIYTFNFGSGGMVPAGSKLAVRFSTVSGTVTMSHGNATDRGDFAVRQQVYNHLPSAVTINPIVGSAGKVTVSWSASTDSDGHTVHYDVFGSTDGINYNYLIARDLPATTLSTVWNTLAAGIGLSGNQNVWIKVFASDGLQKGDGSGANHTDSVYGPHVINNTIDTILPAAITNLAAEERPKTGSVYLTWTAPGDDGNSPTPASQYDIRYSTGDIVAGFNTATQVFGEPEPGFSGSHQGFEVLGLTPGTTYNFAMKTRDEVTTNWSPISNVATANGGLKCGICHGTPPDDAATEGNHIHHGYTLNDCAKCHGPVSNYNTIKHQNGQLEFGFGRDAAGNRLPPVTATVTGANSENIAYWQNGIKIYEDTNGAGGINETAWAGSDKEDTGTCSGFTSTNASGCHGTSSPVWDKNATLVCADCHGDKTRTNDLYGRPYDATVDNGGIVPEMIKGSPPIDNHGFDGTSPELEKRRYVGAHEKHLNSSFRSAKGSSCRMCHMDNFHGDGIIDMKFDIGAGAGATWTPYDNNNTPGNSADDTPGTCGGTSALSCHGTAATPAWDSQLDIKCNNCHNMGGAAPGHVTDPAAGITTPGDGNCEHCHVSGHPREGVLANVVLIPNNIYVGINYTSGGIHLKTNIGGRGPYTTEAEMCWGCHDSQSPKISEWGTNTRAETGNSTYNYGTVTSSNWTTATWSSAKANFAYKTGAIQSTHSTHPDGTSALTWNSSQKRYDETVDAVANIRCSNCHDVHNMNLADGDTSTGTPYLRGSWKGNPYEEDGAPWSKSYAFWTVPSTKSYQSGNVGFGRVPRGGKKYKELGGYYIDENNVIPGTGGGAQTDASYPTRGWSLATSAGLCTLCHGEDANELDQTTGEGLWLGRNGHSNSAIGGTGTYAANIFDFTHGRPVPVSPPGGENSTANNRLLDMAAQDACRVASDDTNPRGYRGSGGGSLPTSGGGIPRTDGPANRSDEESFDCGGFDWGVTVNGTTTEINYHQFSCSKCHNPHASRLPKLMITNCLDVRQNTWDDIYVSQTVNTRADALDKGKKAAYLGSAQNCHRYDNLPIASKVATATGVNIAFEKGTGGSGRDRIIRSSGSFLTAPAFLVGDSILVEGSAGNNGHYLIQSVTTTVIEVASGEVAVAAAATSGITITSKRLSGGWNQVTPW